MELPDPAEAPVAPDCETVHAKVVPATLELRAMDVALPEQMLWEAGVAVTSGTGFTVMVCA